MFGVRVKCSPAAAATVAADQGSGGGATSAAPATVAADQGSGRGANAIAPSSSSSHHPPSTSSSASSTTVAPVELARVRSSASRGVLYTILSNSTLQIYRSTSEYASAMVDALRWGRGRTRTAASNSQLPPWRGKVLLVLAIPKSYSPEEFITFCSDHVNHTSGIQIINGDLVEDRYSALLTFKDQKSADAFYQNMNGWTFSDRGEVCHLLFVAALEFSSETASSTPNAATELPTCPVCVERLGGIIGLKEATCDHSNPCSCFLLWANSSCTVCLSQKQQEGQSCYLCQNESDLSICMVCGFVVCGRYREGHSKSHREETGHSYTLDLQTRKICDGNLEHATEPGFGDLLRIEVEKAIEEPNLHFSRAFEAQRQYYKTSLSEAKEEGKQSISKAVNKAVNGRRQELQLQLKNAVAEKDKAAAVNKKLVDLKELHDSQLAQIEKSMMKELASRDTELADLNEQIRDFKSAFEEAEEKARKSDIVKEKARKSDIMKDATVTSSEVPNSSMTTSEVPNTSDSGGKPKRSGRARKRK